MGEINRMVRLLDDLQQGECWIGVNMQDVLGDREVCIAREITKIHEEYLFGALSEVRKGVKPIGEFVIVVHGATEIRTAAPVTREDVLRTLGMTRNQLYDLFFKK